MMQIIGNEPRKVCSQCGMNNLFHYWSDKVEILTGGTTQNTWIECNHCGHKKIYSTLTTNSFPWNEPTIIQMPKRPEFETF